MLPRHLGILALALGGLLAACDTQTIELQATDRAGDALRVHDLLVFGTAYLDEDGFMLRMTAVNGADEHARRSYYGDEGDALLQVTRQVDSDFTTSLPMTATIEALPTDDTWAALTPAIAVEPDGTRFAATFRFAMSDVAFAPDGCGPVTRYRVDEILHATVGRAVPGRAYPCGEGPWLTDDVEATHRLTITGFVPTATGERGCYRGTVDARAGERVQIPFAPLPADVAACTEFGPPCADEDVCGDGLDLDCDGQIDDGCACEPGAVAACFTGTVDERGVGACRDGRMTCTAGGWGACDGEVAPAIERCNGLDDDCDGLTDEELTCTVTLACPASSTLAEGQPFAPYVLDARTWIDPALVASWTWIVEGGPCDRLLDETTGRVSYTAEGTLTPVLTLRPTLSGDYTITLRVVTTTGEEIICTFVVRIAAAGLRVELCWATTGNDDVDLHLHRPGSTAPWPLGGPASADVCSWQNCKPGAAPRPAWGSEPSPLSACGGAAGPWAPLGHCPNPRLDLDNIDTIGRPENINLDVPTPGATYRIAAHYYGHRQGAIVAPRPMVNVYCGGERVATFGASPDVVEPFVSDTDPARGTLWRVADVTTGAGGDCTAAALHPPGTTTGYWLTSGNTAY